MNNEPVAWMDEINTFVLDEDYKQFPKSLQNGMIPLYTHPVKAQKCVVKDCENHKHQGGFTGDLCNPCYEFISTGKGVYSQAYRNTQTKPLSDDEIEQLREYHGINDWLYETSVTDFARAIEQRHGIK